MTRITNVALSIAVGLLVIGEAGCPPASSADTPTQITQIEKQIEQGGERLKQLRKDLSTAEMDLQRHEARGDLSGKELRDRRREVERRGKELVDLQQTLNQQRGELSSLRATWSREEPEYNRWKADREAQAKAFRDGIDQQIQDVRDKAWARDEIVIKTRRLGELQQQLLQLALEQARLTAAGVVDGRRVAVDTAMAGVIDDLGELERSLAESRATYQRLGGDPDALQVRPSTSLVTPAPVEPASGEPEPASAEPAPADKAADQVDLDAVEQFGKEADRLDGFDRDGAGARRTTLSCLPTTLDPDGDTDALIREAQRIGAAGGYSAYNPFTGLTYDRDRVLKAEAMRVLGGRDGYVEYLKWLRDQGIRYGSEGEAAQALLREVRQQQGGSTLTTTGAATPGAGAMPDVLGRQLRTNDLAVGTDVRLDTGVTSPGGVRLQPGGSLAPLATGRPDSVRADTPALNLMTPALKPAVPALRPATPALQPATPALKPAVPALKAVTPALKPATPTLEPSAAISLDQGLQNRRAPVLNQQLTPSGATRRVPPGALLLDR